ncbi:hypothetical protein [Aminipila luticellarii]|uniref:hypothetical protein n=1 Tax=Aminipila luticellarii TaxID=2507160 RepID=UPI0013E8D244|nr:hypothetical protein [Aminipila luticellarii]
MTPTIEKKPIKEVKSKDLTKEEWSSYILYVINGCIQTSIENQKPTFIGSYH